MQQYSGSTSDGVEVTCTIDADSPEATVVYDGYIRFLFNPDFPQDAKAFFEALCNCVDIIIDERSLEGKLIQ